MIFLTYLILGGSFLSFISGEEIAPVIEALSGPVSKSAEAEPIEVVEEDPSIENGTISDDIITNSTSNTTYKVNCLIETPDFKPIVEIANSSHLAKIMAAQVNITSPQTPAKCVMVLFYSPSCPFSCTTAPHFNALPRAFPTIQMVAVDTSIRYNINTQYGIVGVPSLLLFHNGRPAARFNNTSDYQLNEFAKFITKNTGIKPETPMFVTSADFSGPISSVPEKHTDYILILSWLFIIACALYFFYHSLICQWLFDAVRSAWMEAEAHQHSE